MAEAIGTEHSHAMTVSPPHFQRPDFGRGLYPARFSTPVPREVFPLVQAAARAEGCTVAEFIRRAIAVRLEAEVQQ